MINEQLERTPVEPAFSHFYPFPLDDFQTESIDHIRSGRSVMVAAPTSSGKTVVAEYALWRALDRGGRAIYTTPIKALSNQKRRDLEVLFPGQVGLLTGDRSENAAAPIVVMTTEVLRNMLVEDPQSLNWVTCVVFDEVHYLADQDRGTVWEESIITCPTQIQLVCLSATIANAGEISAWIGETHREIALVRHDERPVPLEHLYYTQKTLHLVRDGAGARRSLFPREEKLAQPHPSRVLQAMARMDLLPAIWFAFSRRGVEEAAEACALTAPPLTGQQRRAIDQAIAWTLASLPAEDRELPQLSLLLALLPRGIGFHHAGILPPLKELVERLFGEGLLWVVCATDTLAVGINMPARAVVISSLDRPFGGLLRPNDFMQLTGRAGRRGIDTRGAVVVLPSPSYRFEEAYRAVCAPLEPIQSAFRLRYSTLLSVMEGRGERLADLVASSLRQYQMKGEIRRAGLELAELEQQIPATLHADHEEVRRYLLLQSELSLAEREQKRARNARSKSRQSAQAIRRHDQAKQERERLSQLVRNHRLHSTAGRLEENDPALMTAFRRMNKLQTIIVQAQRECDQDATETAEAVHSVLTRLGYVDRQGLTRKARGLREIVASAGIVLSELYHRGAFEKVDTAELAEAISWFACDMSRRRGNWYRLPPALYKLRRQAQETFLKIESIEQREGIELVQGPSTWFYGVALAWCNGDSVEEITQRISLGEGDIVSLLNKTIDLLDQFSDLLMQYRDQRMLQICVEARRLLVRGLVAMVRTVLA